MNQDKEKLRRAIYRDANKEKIKEYRAAYYAKNKDRASLISTQWRQDNIDDVKAREHQYRIDNKRKLNKANCDYRQQQKLMVFNHYGCGIIKCALCNENRLGALTIDHVGGGGKQHRILLGTGGNQFYRWLIKEGFPIGYQVLCSNHNWEKYLLSIKHSNTPAAVRSRLKRQSAKDQIMNILGDKCVLCSTTEKKFLTIHHINNDGADHRRLISCGRGGYDFYKTLLKIGDFSNIECRCFNCNDCDEWTPYETQNCPASVEICKNESMAN